MKQLLIILSLFLVACSGGQIETASTGSGTSDTTVISIEGDNSITVTDSIETTNITFHSSDSFTFGDETGYVVYELSEDSSSDEMSVVEGSQFNLSNYTDDAEGVLVIKVSTGESKIVEVEKDSVLIDGTWRKKVKTSSSNIK